MRDQEAIGDLKERLASQARLFEERLSAIEGSQDAGGLQEASAEETNPQQVSKVLGLVGRQGLLLVVE